MSLPHDDLVAILNGDRKPTDAERPILNKMEAINEIEYLEHEWQRKARSREESNLYTLLISLTTRLHPDTFVFAAFPSQMPSTNDVPPEVIHASIREPEGCTIVMTHKDAMKLKIEDFTYLCRKITLEVHSSLNAVGFLAVITGRLKEAGISVNPISGFFHDHLFVRLGREEEVQRILAELAVEVREKGPKQWSTDVVEESWCLQKRSARNTGAVTE